MQVRDFKPANPEVRKNPYPYYALLRDTAPVHPVWALGAYVVSRYEDVVAILRNPALFSSSAFYFDGGLEPDAARPRSRSLIASDPPVHTRMRSLVSQAFTTRRVAALEPHVREVTRGLLSELLREGKGDIISELASPLPVIIISELLGIEPERRADFKRWSDAVVAQVELSMSGQSTSAVEPVIAELEAYLLEVMERRRREPGVDLLSALLQAGDGGGGLTPQEILVLSELLLVAGNETITHVIGNGLLAFIEHPDQWALLRENPSLVPNTIEEILRYDSPAQGSLRRTTADTTIAGVEIAKGLAVIPLLGSANRDPRFFSLPERFDIRRDASAHVSFSSGIHRCLGAPLARLEARIVLEELLAATQGFALAPEQGETVEYIPSFLMRGPRALWLQLEPL